MDTYPKIWFYKDMEAVAIPTVKIQLTGVFYSDIKNYCDLANIALHPCFIEPSDPTEKSEFNIDKIKTPIQVDDKPKKKDEPTCLTIFSKRFDKNSIQALITVLPGSKIETLKYGFT